MQNGIQASAVLKLHPATLEAKKINTKKLNINSSVSIVTVIIITAFSGRSYEVQVEMAYMRQ